MGLEISKVYSRPSIFVSLPADRDVEPPATSSTTPAGLPATFPATVLDSHSETIGKPPIKYFLYKSHMGHGVSSQQRNSKVTITRTIMNFLLFFCATVSCTKCQIWEVGRMSGVR